MGRYLAGKPGFLPVLTGGFGGEQLPLTAVSGRDIVNFMVNYSAESFDRTFGALANPVRRGILARLRSGPASVTELAGPFEISLPGMLKHIGVLENAGLVRTEKKGRVKTCSLSAAPLLEAVEWLGFYREFWTGRLDALGDLLDEGEPQDRKRHKKTGKSKPKRST
jgi:DNA-binding transcriptional ArsR family regulator